MGAARESSVVGILRGASGRDSTVAAVKKHRTALGRWNKVADWFPYVALPAVILSFVICRYTFNDLASYLFIGSVLSVAAESFVVASYVQLKSWRQHPSRLLLYRSFSNVVFAVATIANALRAGHSDRGGDKDNTPNSAWCMTLSFFTQLSFFAGECWLFVISLDLVISLSNPFSSIHGNLSKYKIAVWLASGVSAFALISSGDCQGVTTDHVCWLHIEDLGSSCLWIFILGWVVLYYVFSAAVLGYAFVRISRGLESTYETRKSCVVKNLSVLLAYVGYAIALFGLYIGYVVSEDSEADSNAVGDSTGTKTLGYIITLFVGCRGVVDALLWFRMHRPRRLSSDRAVSVGGRLLSMVPTTIFSKKLSSAGDRSTPLLPSCTRENMNFISPLTSVSDETSVGHTSNFQDSVDTTNMRRPATTCGGTSRLASRLWNGESYLSSDGVDREGVRVSSSVQSAGDRCMNNNVGRLSVVPMSVVSSNDEDVCIDDDDIWVDFSLNPQLNLALRHEVLHFVTHGILQSLHRANSVATRLAASTREMSVNLSSDSAVEERLDKVGDLPSVSSLGDAVKEKPLDRNIIGNLPRELSEANRSSSVGSMRQSETNGSSKLPVGYNFSDTHDYSFQLDQKHVFRDRYPLIFREMRGLSGITDDWYARQIALPAQERLAEGASGAFMFFCGNGEFMVKTISAKEAGVLCSILSKYVTHLLNNPESLLVRFMGLHELRMYSQTFNFVVMKNIFPATASINLKYDIKGSWVNRSASGLMPPGTRSYCKHCGEPFRVGTSGNCPDRIGAHEPNLVLKDNDLTTKIRMKPEDAYEVINALHKDSDALCHMGITDYSLLVGVRNLSYEVDPEATLCKRNKSSGFFGPDRESFDVETRGDFRVALEDHATNNPPQLGGRAANKKPRDLGNPAANADTKIMEGGYAARAVVAPGIYYFGIVDILQTWSIDKILEKMLKVYLFGEPAEGLSCMHPNPYKERFQKKVSDIIEHSIFVREVTGSWRGRRELTGPMTLIPEDIDPRGVMLDDEVSFQVKT